MSVEVPVLRVYNNIYIYICIYIYNFYDAVSLRPVPAQTLPLGIRVRTSSSRSGSPEMHKFQPNTEASKPQPKNKTQFEANAHAKPTRPSKQAHILGFSDASHKPKPRCEKGLVCGQAVGRCFCCSGRSRREFQPGSRIGCGMMLVGEGVGCLCGSRGSALAGLGGFCSCIRVFWGSVWAWDAGGWPAGSDWLPKGVTNPKSQQTALCCIKCFHNRGNCSVLTV